jgi:hypothetical protein
MVHLAWCATCSIEILRGMLSGVPTKLSRRPLPISAGCCSKRESRRTMRLRLQVTFWRRSGAAFTPVPVSGLHASARGDYADRKMAISDVCGLPGGETLLATNRRSLLVVDKLKVVKARFCVCVCFVVVVGCVSVSA